MSAGLGVLVDVGPPPVLVTEGIELGISCPDVVDELSIEPVDGIVLILVLADGGEVELCAGASVVNELFIELVDGTVPPPTLVRGVVELCVCVVGVLFVGLVDSIDPLLVLMVLEVELRNGTVPPPALVRGVVELCVSVVGVLFVGLVDSIDPLLVLMVLEVELRTGSNRYNVLFEGLVNGVANTCELEPSKDMYRSFCRANYPSKLGKRHISVGLVLTQTAVEGTRNREWRFSKKGGKF